MWRGAATAAALCAAIFIGPINAQEVCAQADAVQVCYESDGVPTGYDHAILGDTPEWTVLRIGGTRLGFAGGFFEDIAPNVADVDGKNGLEVIAIHSDFDKGARLVVMSAVGQLIAATDFIGQRHRWFAVAGIGDFDSDGQIEIAYVDRPHLAKELVFLRLDGTRLTEVARFSGLSNHRIGENRISGGRRNCGSGDALIVASGDWTRIISVRIGQGPTDLGAYSAARMAAFMRCQ